MILRFTTDLTVSFTSSTGRTGASARVAVQIRASGGSSRTLKGLADFAIVQVLLSTRGKCGIDALDALAPLCPPTGPWLPPATAPAVVAAEPSRCSSRMLSHPAGQTAREPTPAAPPSRGRSASGMPSLRLE